MTNNFSFKTYILVILLLVHAVTKNSAAVSSKVASAEKKTFGNLKLLTPVPQKDETIDKDNNPSYDFGTANLMDMTQYMADAYEQDHLRAYILGLKHDFLLTNKTALPLTINSFDTDSMYIQARVVRNGHLEQPPFTVGPGDVVRIRVAFNHYSAASGPATAMLLVRDKNLKTPLATLTMKGYLASGVNFSTNAAAFGTVERGQAASRSFTLSFDPESPQHITAIPLRLISDNAYVHVTSVPAHQTIFGVSINNDMILFPAKQIPDFKKKLEISFRADLSPDAPVGLIKGHIRLTSANLNPIRFLQATVIPITGEVTGRARAK